MLDFTSALDSGGMYRPSELRVLASRFLGGALPHGALPKAMTQAGFHIRRVNNANFWVKEDNDQLLRDIVRGLDKTKTYHAQRDISPLCKRQKLKWRNYKLSDALKAEGWELQTRPFGGPGTKYEKRWCYMGSETRAEATLRVVQGLDKTRAYEMDEVRHRARSDGKAFTGSKQLAEALKAGGWTNKAHGKANKKLWHFLGDVEAQLQELVGGLDTERTYRMDEDLLPRAPAHTSPIRIAATLKDKGWGVVKKAWGDGDGRTSPRWVFGAEDKYTATKRIVGQLDKSRLYRIAEIQEMTEQDHSASKNSGLLGRALKAAGWSVCHVKPVGESLWRHESVLEAPSRAAKRMDRTKPCTVAMLRELTAQETEWRFHNRAFGKALREEGWELVGKGQWHFNGKDGGT